MTNEISNEDKVVIVSDVSVVMVMSTMVNNDGLQWRLPENYAANDQCTVD